MRCGLMVRAVAVCLLYLVFMAGSGGVVLSALGEQRRAERMAMRSATVADTAEHLQHLLVGLGATERGYVATRDAKLLDAWSNQHSRLVDLVTVMRQRAQDPGQAEAVQRVDQESRAYVAEHAAPALQAAREGRDEPPASRRDGEQRMAAMQAELDRIVSGGERAAAAHQQRAQELTRRTQGAVVAGVLASVVAGVCLIAYLNCAIVRPVRRAATAAGQLAAGELDLPVPLIDVEAGGRFGRAFDTMGGSLQRTVAQLVRYGRTQAALRRIATRIAQGAAPEEALEAVATELGRLVGTDAAHIVRYRDGSGIVVAAWGAASVGMPVGTEFQLEGDGVSARVHSTGRGARIDNYADTGGTLAAALHERDIRAAVGAPIYVEGRLWGVITATVTAKQELTADAAERLADYAELIATTIANAQARADLATSRVRIVVAADQARRQIERNLHDGIQQQLIAVAMGLRSAEEAVPEDLAQVRRPLSTATSRLTGILDDLREISRGIHPAILTERGLGPALRALARRSALPVEVDLDLDEQTPGRLPEPVQVAAYYIAAEAVTNAAKHSKATHASIVATVDGECLRLCVRDDGVGGADAARGSGLTGIADRAAALGGTFSVTSPPGQGTRVDASLPLHLDTGGGS